MPDFKTGVLTLREVATPADPAPGFNELYFKSDDLLYKKTSAGVESVVGGGGGTPDGLPLATAGAPAATRYVGATTTNTAPTTGTYAVGDFVVSQTGSVYVCTVAGTPGTWIGMYSDGNPPQTLMHEQTASAAATPAAGYGVTYMNAGLLYFKDSAGTVWDLTTKKPLIVRNTVASTNSTVTFATVTGLTLNVAAGKTYRILANGMFRTAATTTGIAFRFGGTATATSIRYNVSIIGGAAANQQFDTYTTMNAVAGASPGVTLTTKDYPFTLEGVVVVNAAGTFTLEFASEVAASAATVQINSILDLQEF